MSRDKDLRRDDFINTGARWQALEERLARLKANAQEAVYKCLPCKDVGFISVETPSGPRTKRCPTCSPAVALTQTPVIPQKTYFNRKRGG